MACRDCFSGTIHQDTSKGRTEIIHGLETYIASPNSEPKGIIVIIPDAFGWELSNSRLLADRYAEKGGYIVYLPEFMAGNAAPIKDIPLINMLHGKGLWANLVKIFYVIPLIIIPMLTFKYKNRPAVCQPRIYNFIRAIRASSDLPIAAAGFCWGGYYTFQLCHETENLIDCGFTAHPSNLNFPSDVEKIRRPISVAIGSDDIVMGKKQVEEMQGILKRREDIGTELVVYDGAKHGFSIRLNPKEVKEQKQATEAEDQAIAWFDKCFSVRK